MVLPNLCFHWYCIITYILVHFRTIKKSETTLNMPSSCCVPMCTSGYKTNPEKVSMFRIPERQLNVWEAAICRGDRRLSAKDHVCEKHFRPDCVLREIKTEVYTYPLRQPKLVEGTIPSIFPGRPKNIISNSKSRKKSLITPVKRKHHLDTQVQDEGIIQQTENGGKYRFRELFQELLDRNVSLDLPSKDWRIAFGSNHICIYRCAWIAQDLCIFDKKIMMGSNSLRYYFLDKLVKEDAMREEDLTDLNAILKNFDSVNMCVGGLKDNEPLQGFEGSYYKDSTDTWRHVKCRFIIDDCDTGDEQQCSFCAESVSASVWNLQERQKVQLSASWL